jgi:hypothetical protein
METYTAVKSKINFSLFAEPFRTHLISGDLGGTTLLPGIYRATEAVRIQNGNLTLDAKGNENAVWIFEFESDFSTIGGAGGNVLLKGDAKATNIFWQTDQLANIGVGTSFKGNILAKMVNQDVDEGLPVKNKSKEQSNMGWPLYGQRL